MSGPCGKEAKQLSSELAENTGTPETHIPEKNPEDETVYPLFGSCANCKVDETAKKTLSACAKCKTAQYCGKECQRVRFSLETTDARRELTRDNINLSRRPTGQDTRNRANGSSGRDGITRYTRIFGSASA